MRRIEDEKMKKNIFRLLGGVASLLCVLTIMCLVGFSCKAASKTTATLSSLDSLAYAAGRVEIDADGEGGSVCYSKEVKKIIFLPKTDVTPYKKYECVEVGDNVYAYFNRSAGIAYIYSNADTIILDSPNDLFYYFIEMESIDFGKKGRVVFSKKVSKLWGMFSECYKLKSVDLSTFDFPVITNLSHMFRNCHSLKSINFGKLNTSKVTSMDEMFKGCESLESLNLSGFKTSNVENFGHMFENCRSLRSLNISSFDTSKAWGMTSMFAQCNNLESLDLHNFNPKKVSGMSNMFEGCEKLQTLDLSSFSLEKTTKTFNMFGGCIALRYVNLSSFDMSKVTDARFMFRGCVALQTIDAPKNAPAGIALTGEYTIDNNRDGYADSNTVYNTIPVSTISNHLISNNDDVNIVMSEGYVRVCEGGNEYHIYPNGRVVAVKIAATGSVKIDTVTARGGKYPITEIADGACKGDLMIKSLTISNSVNVIGAEAFSGCKKLKKVTIEANSQLRVGERAFYKIHKKATIKVKGLKGKVKKKFIKAIKKGKSFQV